MNHDDNDQSRRISYLTAWGMRATLAMGMVWVAKAREHRKTSGI
jgi:hypothetical protein